MEVSGNIGAVLRKKGGTVWTIGPEASVLEAIRVMAEKDIGALPVVSAGGSGGKLVGLISERDYTRKVILKGRASPRTPVGEIMTRELVWASPGDKVVDGLVSMTRHRVRHLPVLEGESLVGIVSIGDLVNWVIGAQTATIDHLEKFITGEYPA